MKDPILLPQNVCNAIVDFINEKRQSGKPYFSNTVLKDDVIDILNNCCTVVYYPFPDDDNNGFHITGIVDKYGNEQHFVYINTAQTIEKQVFTAAHELGHVWKVDEIICQQCDYPLNSETSESIINRFAAELLMPEEPFLNVFYNEYNKHKEVNGGIRLENMFKIVASLANYFYAPYKSIIYRLKELDLMASESNIKLLIGDGPIPIERIENYFKDALKECGYVKFLSPSYKKWISNLTEYLEKAENNQTLHISKINNLRNLFEINRADEDTNLERTVEITRSEGE